MKKLFIGLFVIAALFMIIGCNNKENYTTDDELYDVAIQYIIDNDANPEKNNDRYKMFADYHGFGITEDDHCRYVYMWIGEESYYVSDNKIVALYGSSMPYKFTFELNENKVIKYETPRDGSEYVSSIREMYPDDIENKAINYKWKEDEILKEVRHYYSDLEDNSIYYYFVDKDHSDGEYIKLDK